MHLFPCLPVIAISHRSRKILEDKLYGFDTQTVRKVVLPVARITFDGLSQCVHPRVCCHPRWHSPRQLRIYDSDIRDNLAVDKAQLSLLSCVGEHDRESRLGTGARRCGNTNKLALGTQPQAGDKGVYLLRPYVWSFILHPHRLSCIHNRTPTHSHNQIRPIPVHHSHTLFYCMQRRVGLDLVKDTSRCYPCLGKLFFDLVDEAQPHDVLVGNYERRLPLELSQMAKRVLSENHLRSNKIPHG